MLKYKLILLSGIALLGIYFISINLCLPSGDFPGYSLSKIKVGNKSYCLYLADSDEKRRDGLSNKIITESEGMLFIYKEPSYRRFWMKDMLYSLDLIYLKNGIVVDFHENVSPDTYPKTFTSSSPVNKIIELKAGEIKSASLKKGDIVEF